MPSSKFGSAAAGVKRRIKPSGASKKPLPKKPPAPEGGTARAGAAGRKSASGAWVQFIKDGGIDPRTVARDLGLTKADLAETLGLPADALLREERIMAEKTQARLRELLEILNRIVPWSGGLRQAFAWYRGTGIPALGDETAEAMVKTNRGAQVRTYLNAIAAGSFA